MTPVHYRTSEVATPLGDGFAVKSSCACGQPFTATGGSVERAKRVIKRKARDRRGQAMAAGPGW